MIMLFPRPTAVFSLSNELVSDMLLILLYLLHAPVQSKAADAPLANVLDVRGNHWALPRNRETN